MHACVHTCLHARVYTCMYVCMYACLHVYCMYVCVYVCVYACIHVCMYAGMYDSRNTLNFVPFDLVFSRYLDPLLEILYILAHELLSLYDYNIVCCR